MTYRPGGAHPTGYLRIFILVEMLRRMGFEADAARVRSIWMRLYNPSRGHRIPTRLLSSAAKMIPQVVDEIAFQPRRNLAQRGLADIIRFTAEDERRIQAASRVLLKNKVPEDLPPRFLVSASRYALQKGAALRPLSNRVIKYLSNLAGNRSQYKSITGLVAAGGEK